jgi:hypothetical protein
MDIEIPTKLTEIIGIITSFGIFLALAHRFLKNTHLCLDKLSTGFESLKQAFKNLDEKVDFNDRNTKNEFIKLNESVMDIKIFNGRVDSSLDFIKETMQYHKPRDHTRE